MEKLGMVSYKQLSPSPSRTNDLKVTPPRTVREAMKVRGLISYLRPFTHFASTLLTPLDTLITSTIASHRSSHPSLSYPFTGYQLALIRVKWEKESSEVVEKLSSYRRLNPFYTPLLRKNLCTFTQMHRMDTWGGTLLITMDIRCCSSAKRPSKQSRGGRLQIDN
eukprot:GHVN01095698.1.p1 GENE.GHVN01095698.1~~GHVN01095698.1.p1  ORF type:complete len:190 (+),score=27.09 GHVN01095698.1:76-570(+)